MAPTLPTVEPELHYVRPTSYVPNSHLPIVIYRGVLKDLSDDEIVELMQRNGFKTSGRWQTYKTPHYHSNAHEAYAVVRGSVRYLLGKGPLDNDTNANGEKVGLVLNFKKDDFFILPAGVGHCSIESEGDFEYIGFFEVDAPKWDMNFCKDDAEVTAGKAERCRSVPIPQADPVYGLDGPLLSIWREVAART